MKLVMVAFAYDDPLDAHLHPLLSLRFQLVCQYGRRFGLFVYNLIIVRWYQDDCEDYLRFLSPLSVNK